jgi:toxin secretion/phage lysis holin
VQRQPNPMNFDYIEHILSGLSRTLLDIQTNWLLKGILAVVTAIVGYYAGIHIYLVAIGALVLADVITGVWASFVSGEKFSSKKLSKGLIQKTAIYLIIMAASFEIGRVMQTVIPHETMWLTFVLTALILLYELTSIIENIVVINPDFYFLRRFSNMFEKVVEKQIGNAEQVLGKAKDAEEQPTIAEPVIEIMIEEPVMETPKPTRKPRKKKTE